MLILMSNENPRLAISGIAKLIKNMESNAVLGISSIVCTPVFHYLAEKIYPGNGYF